MMIDRSPAVTPLMRTAATGSAAASPVQASTLGDLPTWKLEDLYPSQTGPEFLGAVEKAASDALAFEVKWKGKLANALETVGPESVAVALQELDALEDLIGRIGSYAGLTYYSDMINPANGKFFGDIQAKLTDVSARLLFFPLELNRLDDDAVDAAIGRDPALAHFKPWIVDLRKDKLALQRLREEAEKAKKENPGIEERLFKARTILIYGGIDQKIAKEVSARLLALQSSGEDPITIFINRISVS